MPEIEFLTLFIRKNMVFGKIDYLNLLPFHVFLKSYPLQNVAKKSIEFKKGVPSKLCKDLYYRRIDAAVISSIESRRSKYKVLDFGICAKKDVKSVLVRKNTKRSLDPASMSSNMLSRILKLDGEVIIGDNALIEYLKCGEDEFYDMGKIWNQRTGLPFVFGRFTYIKNKNSYKKIIKIFLNRNIKIPKYILDNYAISRGVKSNDIIWYLKFISYKIGVKEKKSLKIFLNKARNLKFNPNSV